VPPDKTWAEYNHVLHVPEPIASNLRIAHDGPSQWLQIRGSLYSTFAAREKFAAITERLTVVAEEWAACERVTLFPKSTCLDRNTVSRILGVNIGPHQCRALYRAFLGCDEVAAGLLSPKAAIIRQGKALVGVNHTIDTEQRYYLARCSAGMRVPFSILCLPCTLWPVLFLSQCLRSSAEVVQDSPPHGVTPTTAQSPNSIPAIKTQFENGHLSASQAVQAASAFGPACSAAMAKFVQRQRLNLRRNAQLNQIRGADAPILRVISSLLQDSAPIRAVRFMFWALTGCMPLKALRNLRGPIRTHPSGTCAVLYYSNRQGVLVEVRLPLTALLILKANQFTFPEMTAANLSQEVGLEMTEAEMHLAACRVAHRLGCENLVRVLLQNRCGSKIQCIGDHISPQHDA